MSMEAAIRAIMSVYPLDEFDPDPVRVMMPVDDRAAAAGFGVVQVGDNGGYGCFLIRKGAI
jgi:L-fucose mutarotase